MDSPWTVAEFVYKWVYASSGLVISIRSAPAVEIRAAQLFYYRFLEKIIVCYRFIIIVIICRC